jgi:hypothetical protein
MPNILKLLELNLIESTAVDQAKALKTFAKVSVANFDAAAALEANDIGIGLPMRRWNALQMQPGGSWYIGMTVCSRRGGAGSRRQAPHGRGPVSPRSRTFMAKRRCSDWVDDATETHL